jgi:hypothetical protein
MEADVTVIGGGFAGIAAGVAASNHDQTVILLEKNDRLGGNVTQSFVHTICGLYELGTDSPDYVHDGLPKAFSKVLLEQGLAGKPEAVGPVFVQPIFPEELGEFLTDIVDEFESIKTKFNHTVSDVTAPDNAVRVTARDIDNNKVTVNSKFVIDASGQAISVDPDQRARSPEPQIPSLIARVGGIDDSLTQGYEKLKITRNVASGVKDGDLPRGCESLLLRPAKEEESAYLTLNMPRNLHGGYDPGDHETVDDYYEEARKRVRLIVEYLRETRDELEDLRLETFPPSLGIRETARVPTRYTITEEDVIQGGTFQDRVTRSAWPVELWSEYSDPEFLMPDAPMDIPLRSLVATTHPRIGTAGRCMGATHRALASLRVLGTALATGEAIGTAAALASRSDQTLTGVDGSDVYETIESTNYYIQ